MAKKAIKETAPFEGCQLPVALGAAHLESLETGFITAIMPFHGQSMAVAGQIKAAFGCALPNVGSAVFTEAGDLMWISQGQWYVFSKSDPQWTSALASIAAIVDQSDGYGGLHLSGPDTELVLSRLSSLNFDNLKKGRIARSDLDHIPAIFLPDSKGVRILVPRSYSAAAYENTVVAMKSIAAQKLV